jgi:hypothetical protein
MPLKSGARASGEASIKIKERKSVSLLYLLQSLCEGVDDGSASFETIGTIRRKIRVGHIKQNLNPDAQAGLVTEVLVTL